MEVLNLRCRFLRFYLSALGAGVSRYGSWRGQIESAISVLYILHIGISRADVAIVTMSSNCRPPYASDNVPCASYDNAIHGRPCVQLDRRDKEKPRGMR